jgi:hypothetical protein
MTGNPASQDKWERLAIETIKESTLIYPMEQAMGRYNFRRECASMTPIGAGFLKRL